MECGAQCVITAGMTVMQLLFVNSLDSQDSVCNLITHIFNRVDHRNPDGFYKGCVYCSGNQTQYAIAIVPAEKLWKTREKETVGFEPVIIESTVKSITTKPTCHITASSHF